jgi:hypothetical protein
MTSPDPFSAPRNQHGLGSLRYAGGLASGSVSYSYGAARHLQRTTRGGNQDSARVKYDERQELDLSEDRYRERGYHPPFDQLRLLLCFTSQRHRSLTRDAVACPRAAIKRESAEIFVGFSGSVGAVGRHDNTPNGAST